MKKKLALILIAVIMSFSTVTAFAENVVKYDMGIRQLDSEDIIIKESGAGAFKKDKYLYLRCRHIEFEEGIEADVESGDIKIGTVSVDGDIIKFKVSNESTVASTIRLTNVKLKIDNNLSYGSYPLEIVTEESDDYPDNIFGQTYDEDSNGFDSKYIVLDSNYLTLVKNDSENSENASKEIKVSVSEGSGDGGYINDENRIMLPLRAITEKFSSSAIVSWDDENKTATVMLGERMASFKIGSSTMNINGVDIPCVSPAGIKDGKMYISLRDMATFFGISDENINWDAESKTVTLNYKE